MKFNKNILVVIISFVIITPALGQQTGNDAALTTESYFGFKAPGTTPEVFALGIISTGDHEFSCTMTPDGKTFYFTRRIPELNDNRIMVTELKEDGWTEPSIIPYTEDYGVMEPYITNDGKKFFFQSWKQFEGNEQPSMDIWMMELIDNKWDNLAHCNPPFNPGKAMFISMANNQTIYTTDISKGFNPTRIVYSKFVDGKYQEYQSVGDNINSTGREIYPCVSPNEEFLLFVRGTPEESKIFVSFRQSDGEWGDPIHVDLGFKKASMPRLSPDGKYLFFTSTPSRLKGDIYWVGTKIFEELRPKE